MNEDIDFKKNYLDWLNENIEQYKIEDNLFRITLPFLDRNNDHTEFYIEKLKDNFYRLSDDGNTLNELELSNFDIFNSNKRTEIFNNILNGHGIKKSESNELYVECALEDISAKKHMLSQCMIKISDLFNLSQNNVQSLFWEDVQNYLDENDIRYVSNVSFIGTSTFATNYDFVITKSKKAPERIINVVNNLDYKEAQSILFAWNDVKEQRNEDAKLYTFIHDINKKVSKKAISLLERCDTFPILWSKKDNYTKILSA